jgi:hypothetical protein
MGNYLTMAIGYVIIFVAEAKEHLMSYINKYQDNKYDIVLSKSFNDAGK